jgi:hypothetical protein
MIPSSMPAKVTGVPNKPAILSLNIAFQIS